MNQERTLTPEDLSKVKFTNLKHRTSYTLMMGIGQVKDTLKQVVQKGHYGVCLTENGNMMPILDLYNKSKDKKMLESMGSTTGKLYSVLGVNLSTIENTKIKSRDVKSYNITIYAKTRLGYENACYLTSIGYLDEHFYNKPRIPLNELIKNKEGLIVTSGGYGGIISEAIKEDKGTIKRVIQKITQPENEGELRQAIEQIKQMSGEFSVDIVLKVVDTLPLDEDEKSKLRLFLESEVHLNVFLQILMREDFQKFFNSTIEKFPIQDEDMDYILSLDNAVFDEKEKAILSKILFDTSAETMVKTFKEEFQDDFYLEMNISDMSQQWNRDFGEYEDIGFNPNEKINRKLVELSKQFDIKIIIVQDTYLPKEEDYMNQSIMLWNRPGSKDKFYFNEALYIQSVEEMYNKAITNYPWITDEMFLEYCSNTVEITDKCKGLNLKFRPSLPKLDYQSHYVNLVPVVIQRSLMLDLQDIGLWNESIKKKIKEGECLPPVSEVINEDNADKEESYKVLLEKYNTKESCIDFEDMESRRKENIFLEETLIKMEEHFKDEKDFCKLLRKSKKDIQLRTALKVIIRNKKLMPKQIDEEKLQKIIDKRVPGKKISDFKPEVIQKLVEKEGLMVKDIDPMSLLGDRIRRDRLVLELNTIQYNGILKLVTYFMLLEDVSNFVNENGYLRGLGRGSGAGSIVAHGLDITDCDPLMYGLLFERFLTKERIGEVFFDVATIDLKEFLKTYQQKELSYDEELIDQLKSLIIPERDTEELSQWKEEELFFLECNEDILSYILHAQKTLNGTKVDNINSSTICYLIGITDEKPQSSINATPTTLPDIDYDTNARDEIKEYLVYKFGRSYVTLMGTFNTLKIKGAIKDVIRQLRPEMSSTETNALTAHFEKVKRTDYGPEEEYFEAALKEVPELQQYFSENPDVKDASMSLLGNVRATGIHAGGIVVAGDDVTRVVPCLFERKKENMWVTQPDMQYVEYAGLIKYDVLGLNTLNDISKAFRLIEKRHGVRLSYSKIPLNDPVVMRMFREGDTMSVFQFGTFLAKHIITQLKEVRNINDLAIITSIARPGPLEMGMDKLFIKYVNGEEKIKYMHPALEPILKDTYSIYTFQEQIMQTVRELGDLTGNESVVVLKAMGKKQLDKLSKFESKFKENTIAKYPDMVNLMDFTDPETGENVKLRTVDAIWNLMAAFAKYGFNKSHAIAYSTVSYLSMWLKKYYFVEWITSVLSNASKDDFKEFYAQWHSYIIKPDINKSKKEYIISNVNGEDKTIMPFSFINNVGDKAVDAIIQKQPYNDFEDFFNKIDHRKVNKTALMNLIMSGSMDSFNTDTSMSAADFRKSLVVQYFDLKAKKKKPSKKEQTEINEIIDNVKSMTRGKFLMEEVSLLNLTSFNYMEFYKEHMSRGAIKNFGTQAISPAEAIKRKNYDVVVVGGAVKEIKYFTIKNGKSRGKEMARMVIINEDTEIPITIFADKLEPDASGNNVIKQIEDFTPIIVKGKVRIDPKYGFGLTYESCWVLI